MERGIKIEEILMPKVRESRHGVYDGRTNSRFVHYTSAEAALNIIKNKELWLRNATCMDDYREVQHGFELINSFFVDPINTKMFVDALEMCAPGIGQQAIAQFNKWWRDIQFSSFISSLSVHKDSEDLHGRLSMWRGFGGTAARVAFVINIPWFLQSQADLKIMFNPVSYDSKDQVNDDLIRMCEAIRNNVGLLRSIDSNELLGHVLNMLITHVTCSKHEGFHEEQEWRLLYSPEILSSNLIKKSTEIVRGVPQIVYKIPLDATTYPELADVDFGQIFDRLIIGPSPYPWAMYQAFSDALRVAGVCNPEAKIFASGIPIR